MLIHTDGNGSIALIIPGRVFHMNPFFKKFPFKGFIHKCITFIWECALWMRHHRLIITDEFSFHFASPLSESVLDFSCVSANEYLRHVWMNVFHLIISLNIFLEIWIQKRVYLKGKKMIHIRRTIARRFLFEIWKAFNDFGAWQINFLSLVPAWSSPLCCFFIAVMLIIPQTFFPIHIQSVYCKEETREWALHSDAPPNCWFDLQRLST